MEGKRIPRKTALRNQQKETKKKGQANAQVVPKL